MIIAHRPIVIQICFFKLFLFLYCMILPLFFIYLHGAEAYMDRAQYFRCLATGQDTASAFNQALEME